MASLNTHPCIYFVVESFRWIFKKRWYHRIAIENIFVIVLFRKMPKAKFPKPTVIHTETCNQTKPVCISYYNLIVNTHIINKFINSTE